MSTWGLMGIYLFALGGWVSTAAANIGLAIALAALLLRLRHTAARLRRDPLLWLSLAFGGYLLPLTLWAMTAFPVSPSDQLKEALDLLRLGFLPLLVVAFWLAEHPGRIPAVLTLALAGLLARILSRLDAIDIELFVAGVRAKFGMSPNAFGLYCCVALLGLIVLAPRAWGRWPQPLALAALRLALWLAAMLMMASGVIFAQSRAAWLALVLVFPPTLLWRFLPAWRSAAPAQRRRAWIAAAAGLALAGILVAWNHAIIVKRISASTDSLHRLVQGQDPSGNHDAYTMRYLWWRYAFERFRERPLCGWGPGTVEHLFQTSPYPQIQVLSKRFKDFHNSLLQIVIQVGSLGALLFALQAALVLHSLRHAWRSGWLPRDVALFTLAALVIFLICSFSNLRTRDHFGQFFLMLVGGTAYAWRLRPVPSAAAAGQRRQPLVTPPGRPRPHLREQRQQS
jgi:O-antigen ligase